MGTGGYHPAVLKGGSGLETLSQTRHRVLDSQVRTNSVNQQSAMADYGSDRSEEAAVSDGSGSEADLGTEKPMEKTRYMGPKWTGNKAEHADWQWEVDPYMLEAGFKAVMYEKGRRS